MNDHPPPKNRNVRRVKKGFWHAEARMSDEQLREAKEYGRIGLVCQIADKLLDVAFLAVWRCCWPDG